ncbi:MAG: peptidoglycan-binding domain-containing protein [Acidimicrobiales bacterium]
MRILKVRLIITIAVCAIFSLVADLFLPAGAASAHYLPQNFSLSSDLVGYCGQTNSGWVMAVEGRMATIGAAGSSGFWGNGLDFQWGPTMQQATINWQRFFGISPDGCVGPQTWATMTLQNINLFFLGNVGTGQYWMMTNSNHNRDFGMYIDACYGAWADISSGTTASPFVFNNFYRVGHTAYESPPGFRCL